MDPAHSSTLLTSRESTNETNDEPPGLAGREARGWRGARRKTGGDDFERRAVLTTATIPARVAV